MSSSPPPSRLTIKHEFKTKLQLIEAVFERKPNHGIVLISYKIFTRLNPVKTYRAYKVWHKNFPMTSAIRKPPIHAEIKRKMMQAIYIRDTTSDSKHE